MGYTPPTLYVNKVAGGWSLTPPDNTTTDDLFIYANSVDTTPQISLLGASSMYFYVGTAKDFDFLINGTNRFKISYTAIDTILEGTTANDNIFIKPTGTGNVKFGTYTAGAATDSTGYITILDSAGNTRKLMVQA